MTAAFHALLRAAFLVCALAAPAFAQSTKPPASVEQLIRLLDEPEVRAWLEQAKADPVPAPAEPPVAPVQAAERLNAVRDHLRDVAAAFRVLPEEIARAIALLRQELSERGFANVLLLLVAFVALGYGSEQAFWHATARTRAWIGARQSATVPERLRLIGLRLGFGLALVAIFGIGSIGAFLLFDWPPLLHQIVVGYLVAVLAIRLALIIGRVFLEPGGRGLDRPEEYRVIPMSTAAARFWYRRLGLFVGYLALGLATLSLLDILGFPAIHRSAAGYVLALGLLAIAFEALWRRPAEPAARRRLVGRTALNILLTAYGVLLWLLRVAGLNDLFWLAAVAFLLPAAIRIGDAAVVHLLRPSETGEEPRRGILEVCIERGLRTLLIVAAAVWLANVWGIDLIELTSRDTLGTRLVRGILSGIVTLLIADFIWQVAKAAVDAKLAETAGPVEHGSGEAVRNARTRTLLPIFRNILFAVIAVLAGLTALSALGVDIGPLIAGAGVLGVAVGFGAQTLVKDIISGIFYLLDDAFRVGEYIQSGSYKGTVESFSLRSVKLRHHRGPVYTVPFGELGAVQNMSRDWVIDKFQIGVTYDTNLELARKIIKKIGTDLAADPEFGRHIIEPLKMQGVEQFGDYAIQIRCKMTTRPGEQFVIRRKAFAKIKQAFDEAGIDFAFPTVQVAGSDDKISAAASQLLEKPAAAAV